MSDAPHTAATRSPILKAIAGSCPRCGRGRLFRGVLKVADRCAACGLDYSHHDAADGPAVFVTFVVGAVAAGGAVWLDLARQPPIWVHFVLWPPIVIGLSLLLLRPLKGFFIGAQYKYRAVDRELPERH